MFKGGLGVDRLPENDDVNHDAEAVELAFLPDLVALAELAALLVENVAGQRLAAFAPAGHVMDRPAMGRVVDSSTCRVWIPAEFGQGAGEAGRVRCAGSPRPGPPPATSRPPPQIAYHVREIEALGLEVTLARTHQPDPGRPASTQTA